MEKVKIIYKAKNIDATLEECLNTLPKFYSLNDVEEEVFLEKLISYRLAYYDINNIYLEITDDPMKNVRGAHRVNTIVFPKYFFNKQMYNQLFLKESIYDTRLHSGQAYQFIESLFHEIDHENTMLEQQGRKKRFGEILPEYKYSHIASLYKKSGFDNVKYITNENEKSARHKGYTGTKELFLRAINHTDIVEQKNMLAFELECLEKDQKENQRAETFATMIVQSSESELKMHIKKIQDFYFNDLYNLDSLNKYLATLYDVDDNERITKFLQEAVKTAHTSKRVYLNGSREKRNIMASLFECQYKNAIAIITKIANHPMICVSETLATEITKLLEESPEYIIQTFNGFSSVQVADLLQKNLGPDVLKLLDDKQLIKVNLLNGLNTRILKSTIDTPPLLPKKDISGLYFSNARRRRCEYSDLQAPLKNDDLCL